MNMTVGGVEDFLENIAIQAGKAGLNAINSEVQKPPDDKKKADDAKKSDDATAKKPAQDGIPMWFVLGLVLLLAMRK